MGLTFKGLRWEFLEMEVGIFSDNENIIRALGRDCRWLF